MYIYIYIMYYTYTHLDIGNRFTLITKDSPPN